MCLSVHQISRLLTITRYQLDMSFRKYDSHFFFCFIHQNKHVQTKPNTFELANISVLMLLKTTSEHFWRAKNKKLISFDLCGKDSLWGLNGIVRWHLDIFSRSAFSCHKNDKNAKKFKPGNFLIPFRDNTESTLFRMRWLRKA